MSNYVPFEMNGYSGIVSKDHGVLVVQVPSGENIYDVTVFAEDDIECDCKGWFYRQSCKHALLVRNLL